MPQPKTLRLHDIVIPNMAPSEPYYRMIPGKIVDRRGDLYVVEFDGHRVMFDRMALTLTKPYLKKGDRVMIVPDPPEQVESLLRLSTTDEMAIEVGIVRRVGTGWGMTDLGKGKPTTKNRTPDSFWYYDVEWPSGHRDHFLHDGDLARVEDV